MITTAKFLAGKAASFFGSYDAWAKSPTLFTLHAIHRRDGNPGTSSMTWVECFDTSPSICATAAW